jgi:hypothetical protein
MLAGDMMSWIVENKILSGSGAALLTGIGWIIGKIFKGKVGSEGAPVGMQGQSISIIQSNNLAHNSNHSSQSSAVAGPARCFRQLTRESVRILFIDDDTQFKVVKIMKGAGFSHVRIVKDIKHLSSPEVVEADVFFVDIQGVGKALEFSDEGLGLALALKTRYPEKRVVIYSAQTNGDRFHQALNKADASLAKNAEPYQFISLVEEFLE